MLEYLRARLESGAFRPVLDRTYPLEDIVEAYRYVESGQKVGNVVIAVVRRLTAAGRAHGDLGRGGGHGPRASGAGCGA